MPKILALPTKSGRPLREKLIVASMAEPGNDRAGIVNLMQAWLHPRVSMSKPAGMGFNRLYG